jgi:glycosyltransferase involved in cell wall biosynthesis
MSGTGATLGHASVSLVTRPACLITGILSEYRQDPFRLLAAAEDVEVITWRDTGTPVEGLTVHRTGQFGAVRLVASGRYRAVICSLGGRIALPGAYLAARARGIPFVLWATLWSHPRTPAHALSYLPALHLYRNADAIVTYGPHVSAYVARYRKAGYVFEAPQAVEVERFSRPITKAARAAVRSFLAIPEDGLLVLFVGRLVREKGIGVLLEAWELAGLEDDAVLALAGDGPLRDVVRRRGSGARSLGYLPRSELRSLYAAADILVLPSIRTANFAEPWGLVVNEAMLQGTPVIATDAVGAVVGGLVQNRRNGLVVRAGDPVSLAAGLRTLAKSKELRERLGDAARKDAALFTPQAWVEGLRQALTAVGASREPA